MRRRAPTVCLRWLLWPVRLASDAGAVVLALQNGWTTAPYGNSRPETFRGFEAVYLKGAMSSGTSNHPFTLPPILRLDGHVYVPIDLCNGNKGRFIIHSTGVVLVEERLGAGFANAQCFTSLDGVYYAVPEPAVLPALAAGVLLAANPLRSASIDSASSRRETAAPAISPEPWNVPG
jgi:hypothetical protein